MITEQDMREFFQKMIDTVSQLSTQAAKVEGLETRVNELSNRLRAVEEENRNLRTQLDSATAEAHAAHAEAESLQVRLETERAVGQSLRDTIVQRDAGVVSLETDLRGERESHTVTKRERDEARNEVGDLQALVQSLRDQLAHTGSDRDSWQERAFKAEAHVREVQGKLDKVMSVLQPLTVVPSQDVAAS